MATETQLITFAGTPYEVVNRGEETRVTVGDNKAAKRVRQDASGNRWRSLDGQTFADLDEVADSMGWAL